jgi:3',5'-cyclic AMP phosphodiesterase CpdA
MARIAHVSDIHFGDARPAVLEAARAALNRLGADCIIATGDITEAGRRREFAAASAWFKSLDAPIAACPGNHDAPVFSLFQRFTAPFARFEAMGLPAVWARADGTAAASCFNTARGAQNRLDWSQGVCGIEDLEAALAWCAGAAPAGWRIVACHHPPTPPDGARLKTRTRHGAAALDRLQETSHTLMLCGHVHAFTRTRIGGALVITAPSLASGRDRGSGLGFLALDLAPALVTATRWSYDGAAFRPEPPLHLPAFGAPAATDRGPRSAGGAP